MGLTVELQEVSRWKQWWLTARGADLMDLTPMSGSHGAQSTAMESSQSIASVVAARKTGDEEARIAVEIQEVAAGSPAAAAGFEPGDVIVEVGFIGVTVAVTTPADVSATVVRAGPGQRVRFEVIREGAVRRMAAVVGSDGRIGVTLGVTADTGPLGFAIDGVSGASAGLAMTLALIDALGPGDLTAGLMIAATGEIALDGSVRPIGGLTQKLSSKTARRADVVFVPADQPEQTTMQTVVRVDSVDQALAYLCSRGATDSVCLRISKAPAPSRP
jgi:PDZ domain-containing protein